jgi:hypothetical protein
VIERRILVVQLRYISTITVIPIITIIGNLILQQLIRLLQLGFCTCHESSAFQLETHFGISPAGMGLAIP